MKIVSALLLTTLTTPAFAVQDWTIDSAQSKLGFTAQQGDEKFNGGFKQFTIDLRFSPDDLAHSTLKATIATGSAFAGSADRDSALPESTWFDVAHFPDAVFTSDSIKTTGKDQYLAEGKLSIRGISKPVQLPFTLTTENGKTHAVGSTVIQRNDYGVGQGEYASDAWIKFPVTVAVDIWATPKS